jgi:hypothetical protein
MKKILILFSLILSFAIVKAQDLTVSLNDGSPSYFGTIFATTGTSLVQSGTITYKIKVDAPFPVLPYIQIYTAKVSGVQAYTAKVEESLTDTAYYAMYWTGGATKGAAATDTSIVWNNRNARLLGRYIKVSVTATSTTQSEKFYGKIRLVKSFKGQ